MKKCISCASELFPQGRFCGTCGTLQPAEVSTDETTNDQTVLSSMVATANMQLSATPIPPPPPPQQHLEERENENKRLALPLPEFSEYKLDDTPSTGQIESQWHGYHLQPQQVHGYHLQPQQLHGEHMQPQQLHGEHMQPQQYYGSHQQPQQLYGSHQQPYHHYQQPPNPWTHTTPTAAKVGTAVTKTGSTIVGKWVLITVIAATVLGASGVGVALAFHPFHLITAQPVMSIFSQYNAQGKPIAANGTTLHVSGQNFTANSPITFLLDNTPLNETQRTQSDSNGNVTTDLTVTPAWIIGQHTLTAHDASNTTTSAMAINIVQPGQSNTPGPNGAPPDDASFTIQLNVHGTKYTNDPAFPYMYTLIITGHPDPTGGTVCASRANGAPVSVQGNNTVTYHTTSTYTCSGTYKGGTLSYSETLQTQTMAFSNGEICTLKSPQQSFLQITGSYTDQHHFSGKATELSIDVPMYNCTPAGSTGWWTGDSGTWTGTVR